MLDPIVNPWDVLPVIPVVRGAGWCCYCVGRQRCCSRGFVCGCNPEPSLPCFRDLKRQLIWFISALVH